MKPIKYMSELGMKRRLDMKIPPSDRNSYQCFTVDEINRIMTVIEYLNEIDENSCENFKLEMVSVDRIEITKGNTCMVDLEAFLDDDHDKLRDLSTIYNLIVKSYSEHVEHVNQTLSDFKSGNINIFDFQNSENPN